MVEILKKTQIYKEVISKYSLRKNIKALKKAEGKISENLDIMNIMEKFLELEEIKNDFIQSRTNDAI